MPISLVPIKYFILICSNIITRVYVCMCLCVGVLDVPHTNSMYIGINSRLKASMLKNGGLCWKHIIVHIVYYYVMWYLQYILDRCDRV